MTEDRIITGLEVTTGEAGDGKQMGKIVEQSRGANGIEVEEVCGDTAYSSKGNMEYARENGIKLISRLHPIVSNGAGTAAPDCVKSIKVAINVIQ